MEKMPDLSSSEPEPYLTQRDLDDWRNKTQLTQKDLDGWRDNLTEPLESKEARQRVLDRLYSRMIRTPTAPTDE